MKLIFILIIYYGLCFLSLCSFDVVEFLRNPTQIKLLNMMIGGIGLLGSAVIFMLPVIALSMIPAEQRR